MKRKYQMIKKSTAMKNIVLRNMRGGDGEVLQQLILDDTDMARHSRLFATLTLKEGCSIGEHRHDNETEYYYILSGKGIVKEADGEKTVSAGDVVITADGESHSIRNTGKEDLVLLAIIILD